MFTWVTHDTPPPPQKRWCIGSATDPPEDCNYNWFFVQNKDLSWNDNVTWHGNVHMDDTTSINHIVTDGDSKISIFLGLCNRSWWHRFLRANDPTPFRFLTLEASERCDHWTCHVRWRSKAEACYKFHFVARNFGKKLPFLIVRPSYPPKIFKFWKPQRREGKGKVSYSLKKPSKKSEDWKLFQLSSFPIHIW